MVRQSSGARHGDKLLSPSTTAKRHEASKDSGASSIRHGFQLGKSIRLVVPDRLLCRCEGLETPMLQESGRQRIFETRELASFPGRCQQTGKKIECNGERHQQQSETTHDKRFIRQAIQSMKNINWQDLLAG